MNPNPNNRSRLTVGALLVACLIFAPAGRADLIVDLSTTSLGGGIYQYDFNIENTGPDDVAIVSIVDAPVGDLLIGPTLTTPAGFLGSYDGGLGFVDFLGDASLFSALSSLGGFSFQSAVVPGQYFTAWEALTSLGEPLSGSVNQPSNAVPDGGSAALMASLGLVALALFRRKV